jgi:hypothetical protein
MAINGTLMVLLMPGTIRGGKGVRPPLIVGWEA